MYNMIRKEDYQANADADADNRNEEESVMVTSDNQIMAMIALEAQWLVQDLRAQYPDKLLNARRKNISTMLDRLIDRSTTPTMKSRLLDIRSRVPLITNVTEASCVLYDITTLLDALEEKEAQTRVSGNDQQQPLWR